MAESVSDRVVKLDADEARRMLAEIADMLWPGGDPDAEWDSETIEHVAGVFHAAKLVK